MTCPKVWVAIKERLSNPQKPKNHLLVGFVGPIDYGQARTSSCFYPMTESAEKQQLCLSLTVDLA